MSYVIYTRYDSRASHIQATHIAVNTNSPALAMMMIQTIALALVLAAVANVSILFPSG